LKAKENDNQNGSENVSDEKFCLNIMPIFVMIFMCFGIVIGSFWFPHTTVCWVAKTNLLTEQRCNENGECHPFIQMQTIFNTSYSHKTFQKMQPCIPDEKSELFCWPYDTKPFDCYYDNNSKTFIKGERPIGLSAWIFVFGGCGSIIVLIIVYIHRKCTEKPPTSEV
jgi:hypothetical protein